MNKRPKGHIIHVYRQHLCNILHFSNNPSISSGLEDATRMISRHFSQKFHINSGCIPVFSGRTWWICQEIHQTWYAVVGCFQIWGEVTWTRFRADDFRIGDADVTWRLPRAEEIDYVDDIRMASDVPVITSDAPAEFHTAEYWLIHQDQLPAWTFGVERFRQTIFLSIWK